MDGIEESLVFGVVLMSSKELSNLMSDDPFLSIEKLDSKIKANIAIARVQVVLSRKLFVFWTPPRDCAPPPPNEEDSPPP